MKDADRSAKFNRSSRIAPRPRKFAGAWGKGRNEEGRVRPQELGDTTAVGDGLVYGVTSTGESTQSGCTSIVCESSSATLLLQMNKVFTSELKKRNSQLFYHRIHPRPVLRFLLPALLRHYPQVVRKAGVNGSSRALPSDDTRNGCGGNASTERNLAGENLQPIRLLCEERTRHHIPRLQPSRMQRRLIPCYGVQFPS